MRELARAVFGEKDAVVGTKTSLLALVIRTIARVATVLVDEAVPHVYEDNACPLRAHAIKVVEVACVGRRFRALDRRQSDPEHRHALAFKCRDRVVDAFIVDPLPLLGTELERAARLTNGLLFGCLLIGWLCLIRLSFGIRGLFLLRRPLFIDRLILIGRSLLGGLFLLFLFFLLFFCFPFLIVLADFFSVCF